MLWISKASICRPLVNIGTTIPRTQYVTQIYILDDNQIRSRIGGELCMAETGVARLLNRIKSRKFNKSI
jgi:hypothetical protein